MADCNPQSSFIRLQQVNVCSKPHPSPDRLHGYLSAVRTLKKKILKVSVVTGIFSYGQLHLKDVNEVFGGRIPLVTISTCGSRSTKKLVVFEK